MSSTPNSLTSQEVDEINKSIEQRVSAGGFGLSQQSMATLKSLHPLTGGVMMRAGFGRLGATIKARRILNLMIALDGSGSMEDQRGEVVAGLNLLIDELADVRNPERDSIELTIFIFSGTDAKLFNVGGLEVANVPITTMPHVTLNDYQVGSLTPMNKTILTVMGSGSLRAERLRMGVDGSNRRASMNYLVVVSDGKNNIAGENSPNGYIAYDDSKVQQIARDLLTTEQWILAVAYAGSDDSAENVAKRIGFPQWKDVKDGGYRAFFKIVSQSAKTASRAATASQANNNNSFLV